MIKEAKALEAAGCFSVVLECVPGLVAAAVTRELGIPTIGIGAGPGTSGQVGVGGVCVCVCMCARARACVWWARAAGPLRGPRMLPRPCRLPPAGAGVPRPAGHDAAPAPRQGHPQVLQAVLGSGGSHTAGGGSAGRLGRGQIGGGWMGTIGRDG